MVDVQGVVWVLSGQAGDQLQSLAHGGHEAEVKAWDPALRMPGSIQLALRQLKTIPVARFSSGLRMRRSL